MLLLLCKVWLLRSFGVATAPARGSLCSSSGWWSLWCSVNVVAVGHAWQHRAYAEHCAILGSPHSQPYAGTGHNISSNSSSNKGLKGVYCCIVLHGNPSQSYGGSLAIWDHSVLPDNRHRWTWMWPPFRQASTWFTYHRGMEGWVDLGGRLYTEMVYLSTDSCSSNY